MATSSVGSGGGGSGEAAHRDRIRNHPGAYRPGAASVAGVAGNHLRAAEISPVQLPDHADHLAGDFLGGLDVFVKLLPDVAMHAINAQRAGDAVHGKVQLIRRRSRKYLDILVLLLRRPHLAGGCLPGLVLPGLAPAAARRQARQTAKANAQPPLIVGTETSFPRIVTSLLVESTVSRSPG